ncbi:MAG: class II glutamine amidotransferase, partial [Burkholderiales bacterium]
TAHHADGWGVAFFEGLDVRMLREPVAAATSPLVRLIESEGPRSTTVISHIRHATRGGRTLANTQPFARELVGRMHVFAHNGDLGEVTAHAELGGRRFRAVGETDSEFVFCGLLDRLASLWTGASIPPVEARMHVLRPFANALRALGPANFLYSDGDILFAHAHRRTQSDGSVRPPGLWMLERQCIESQPNAETNGISLVAPPQSVVLIASVPLTDEPWWPIEEGQILAAQAGRVLAT